ncbi:MAG: helix-turn-helix transcriptional regulator [Propionicimonas sp.]|nr:helix-turn-helix transcriptional regulator [Propionicimonas sp.]
MASEYLAASIRAVLEERERSQAWLSRESDIPRASLARKLAGGRFTVVEVARIAQALDVSPSDLLEGC